MQSLDAQPIADPAHGAALGLRTADKTAAHGAAAPGADPREGLQLKPPPCGQRHCRPGTMARIHLLSLFRSNSYTQISQLI